MARLTLYTHPSRRGNPYHNKVYPHAYDRIAGLAVDRGIPMWVNDRNVGPSNVYDLAQLDTSEVSVPRWLARRISAKDSNPECV